jgi:hypothetical protein
MFGENISCGMKMESREEIRLYNLSLVPAGVIFIVFLFLFIYLLQNKLLATIWDFLWFAIPFWMLIIETIFFSFESFYKRQFNKPFNLKRLIGRTTITIIGSTLLLAIAIVFKNLQFSWMSESIALLLIGITWFVIWIILFISFKQMFSKLSQGKW